MRILLKNYGNKPVAGIFLSKLDFRPCLLPILLIGCAAFIMNAAFAENLTAPPAASLAFTSRDTVVINALKLFQDGKFKAAEALLRHQDKSANAESLRARQEAVEVIERTRYEYSLDEAGLLAKVRKDIPDVSKKEVGQWAAESNARFKIIDGKKMYFRREPQNIYLFSEEAKRRRLAAGIYHPDPKWDLVGHLKEVVEEADRTSRVEVQPVVHRVDYSLTIASNAPGVHAGSSLRVWLPFPQEYRQQRDIKLISASPEPKLIAPPAIEGDPVGGGAQRTVYFEQTVTDPRKPIEFKIAFEYTSYAYFPRLEEKEVQPLPAGSMSSFLAERPPHIVFTAALRRQVADLVGTETNSLVKARKIFRWVSRNVPWNAEDEYSIIPSFSAKGFTSRRGDCGIQNTVFITMCRIAGVPARWQSGYETKPGKDWGMHDWAEIYLAPWGWLPADASYGVQKSDDPRIADFYCGHQDSYRMIVNLDWGRELFPPKNSLRSDPSDFQRGEVEVDGKNLYYDHWDSKMEVDRHLMVNRP